jgi:hypothetical protein
MFLTLWVSADIEVTPGTLKSKGGISVILTNSLLIQKYDKDLLFTLVFSTKGARSLPNKNLCGIQYRVLGQGLLIQE